jgi:hypothetical protein
MMWGLVCQCSTRAIWVFVLIEIPRDVAPASSDLLAFDAEFDAVFADWDESALILS